MPLPESPRVLDVGCGTGSLIPFLREYGIQDILAVDISDKMLERLHEKFPAASKQGNVPGRLPSKRCIQIHVDNRCAIVGGRFCRTSQLYGSPRCALLQCCVREFLLSERGHA